MGYRLMQFWRALFARLSPAQRDAVRDRLGPTLYPLFASMHPSEQYHSYAVWQRICANGECPDDLAVAALLHDVGKSTAGIALWERVLVVLGKRFAPEKAAEWGRYGTPSRWLKAFVVAERHPLWSAALVEKAGGSDTAVWLVKHHQRVPDVNRHPDLLARLMAADDEN